MSTPPDYGEPWEATNLHFLTTKGNFSMGVLASRHSKRIARCVNACQGMTDPEAEIQAMRDKLTDIRQRLNGHADSKLNGEYGLAAATMRGFEILQADNEAMLDAIQAMREAITEAISRLEEYIHFLRSCDGDTENCKRVITKLQPFIKP